MPLKGMAEVKKMIAANKKQANEDIKSLYFVGLRAIIKGTPVDEGRARNNWFLTVGNPSGLVGREDSASGGGSEASLMTMPEYVLNKKIYFTNNLPYIETLEYGGYPNPSNGDKTTGGYSTQLTPFKSPKGWVRATLIGVANEIKKL
tara:strand:+ start:65 stop:505 length:441 start_codon:yes stop_codon:yes gene_type:complete